jgi:hypothetical protein
MSNNNILIGAEGLDGANFLVSCLSMSDKVYYNNCTLKEKIEFFFRGMSNIQKKNGLPIWSDVTMLFHTCARIKNDLRFSTHQSKKLYESVKSTVNDKTLISKVAMPQPWPLKILMSKNPEDPLVKLFESKYFIGLVNPDLFISLRTLLDDKEFVDDSIPDLDLFTIQEFNLLSEEEKQRIKDNYRSGIERLFKFKPDIPTIHARNMSNMECHIDYRKQHDDVDINMDVVEDLYNESNDFVKTMITYEWDCNWFLSEDETVENIKFLYSELNLGELNEKLIRKMHKTWIDRMDYIKRSHIKEFKSNHK